MTIHRALYASLCIALLHAPAVADVVLSEILADNGRGLRDADGDASDWIELHNDGPTMVDLAGWALSEDPSHVVRWILPSRQTTRLAPGGFLVVFASGKDRISGELHTDFRLSSSGEYLALLRPDGSIASAFSPTFPSQREDISFGVSSDGVAEYYAEPSPGRPNTAKIAGLVADTEFSHDRGFYDAPFTVVVSTDTPGARIRYTLDGTAPDPSNGFDVEGPIEIRTTTTLRARAYKDGLLPSDVDTQTYLFISDVLRQPAHPEGYPSSWDGLPADYAVDPEIALRQDSPTWVPELADDLRAIPTLSVVMDPDDFVGPERGIYTHPLSRGVEWERPASVEWIGTDGTGAFQVDCGIRIMGNSSARPIEGKHSFRLLFKDEYGPRKLREPIFGESKVEEFDTIALRCFSTDSWHFKDGGSRYRRWDSQYIRDVFLRDSQIDMGHASARSTYVHLYINGLYWGLYDPAERPDDSFAASHLGGRAEEWDVVKDASLFRGSLDPWTRLLNMVRVDFGDPDGWLRAQGLDAFGQRDPALVPLLDADNLIDYMILHLWAGAEDWPHHNWYAARDRTGNHGGWKFFVWDQEIVLDFAFRDRLAACDADSPAYIHHYASANPEYRLRFADRIQRHLYRDGALSIDACRERWMRRADEIDRAITGESARWGDFRLDVPDPSGSRAELYTRDDHWLPEQRRVIDEYIPRAHELALQRFASAGLYPELSPPALSPHGGLAGPNGGVRLSADRGSIYFTLDGTDPRVPGGAPHPAAIAAGVVGEPLVAAGDHVRVLVPSIEHADADWTARSFDDSSWIEGTTGVGFERATGYESFLGTDLSAEMDGINASVWIRAAFDHDGTADGTLTLRMRYDDGFVAWINGREVARRNAPTELPWNASATSPHPDGEAIVYESIAIDEHADALRSGHNVLAIHGLNSSASSNDALFVPELLFETRGDTFVPLERTTRVRARAARGDEWSALVEALWVSDASALRVTEIMYHPPAGLDPALGGTRAEFVEIQNTGAHPIDLSGVELRGGVTFRFDDDRPEETDLAPGEAIVLVRDRAAFAFRYPDAVAAVAGRYDGALSNGAEDLVLVDAAGSEILRFSYDDAWYEESDGRGHSLEIVDPALPVAAWSEPASWRPSAVILGSPGLAAGAVRGGLQIPGDVDQSGRLDITDAIGLLGHLFRGQPTRLPCATDEGRLSLADIDANGRIDLTDAVRILTFLFAAGPPPALGEECVPIGGCPDRCRR